MPGSLIRVLGVDDNELVNDALGRRFGPHCGIEWLGALNKAGELPGAVAERRPEVVLVDLDMPGEDPLTVVRHVTAEFPSVRCVVLSGHHRADLIDRAFASGAWGYLSKADSTTELCDALVKVRDGELVMSRYAREALYAGSSE